jgi:hypothetical protein
VLDSALWQKGFKQTLNCADQQNNIKRQKMNKNQSAVIESDLKLQTITNKRSFSSHTIMFSFDWCWLDNQWLICILHLHRYSDSQNIRNINSSQCGKQSIH